MPAFILRRLVQLVFVVWGGATLLFVLVYALPNKPAELLAGGANRAPNPQVVKNVAAKYGLDKPLYVQYGHYIGRLVHFDFGQAYRTTTLNGDKSVNAIIKERAPKSLRLAFWAILLEIVIGISSGMLSARRRNSLADTATTLTAVVASAIPVFVLGFLIKQVTGVVAFQHHWPQWARFPTEGLPTHWYLGIIPAWSQIKLLVQPAIVLAAVTTAILARITRTTVLESMRADHVRTARAKGLDEGTVMRKHVLRNALIPVVTIIGIDFGTAAGAAILTETVFNIQGLGKTIVTAAQNADLPTVLGLSVVVMVIYGLANLAVDVSYAILDPRVRLGEQ